MYIHLKVTTKTEHQELVDVPFRVGGWLVEPCLNRLTRGGESIQIELKMMDVLVCLAERAGELVTRREITDTVWATEFITEKTLTRAVAELRRTLGDDARQPRYIETIHRKGYRLIAPAEVVEQPAATVTPFPTRSVRREDDRSPYPGLAAFTEADAELFFGREAEVVQLWRSITTQRLLAVIGPSGVGKSSFLRAGLIPAAPEGWGTLVCQPGEAPFAALARALAPQFEGDPEAISELVDIGDRSRALAVLSRWRDRLDRSLLIIDQFEELFTLNPPEVRARFAELIGSLTRDADVHVLLSMRDDFLYRCHDHEALLPIFSGILPIKVPARDDLHRAVIEPAARFGYSFEDENLAEEMLDAVTDERGALPLLAFAVARLWEKRDRERKLLTLQAYDDIGGVAGALAHHAEATLERIGRERLAVVRELFRNLVTAEGTRAVREWDELLSVFDSDDAGKQIVGAGFIPAREAAEDVLRELIDARLLTSYEICEDDEEPTRRVEIIHESLLTNWPRLVGWQTQDADSARLRDELRQAARTWREHDRSDDLLWAGSAYREFAVWRERYPGGLSELEDEYSWEMAAHARRSKRRRRIRVAAAFAVLLAVLAVVGVSRQHAIAEANRAEAANLFSLGQLRLEEHPSDTIAYAIASLELADSPDVRRLALEALWRGPTAIRLRTFSSWSLDFSPDGRWLATADRGGGGTLWPSDGGPPTILEGSDVATEIRFSPRGGLVAANMDTERQEIGLWSFPEGRFLRSFALGEEGFTRYFRFSPDGKRLITSTQSLAGEPLELEIRSWPVEGGEPDLVARFPLPLSNSFVCANVNPTWSRLSWPDGRRVRIARLQGTTLHLASATSVGHDRAIAGQIFDEQGRQLATADTAGTIRVWSLEGDSPELTHTLGGEGGVWASALMFNLSGSMLSGAGGFLWDLTAPPGAEPLRIRAGGYGLAFDPSGNWLATSAPVSLWPLARTYPRVLRGHEERVRRVAFTPDGKRLVSASDDGSVRVWPLGGSDRERPRILYQTEGALTLPVRLAMAPDGSFVVISNLNGQVKVLPLDGGPGRELGGFTDEIRSLAVGPQARLVAAGAGGFIREQAIVRVWDLESGEVRILDAGDGKTNYVLEITGEDDVWVKSGPMLRRWSLEAANPRMVEEIDLSSPDFAGTNLQGFDPDRRLALLQHGDRAWLQHLDTHDSRELSSHRPLSWCHWSVDHEIVFSFDRSGGVRVGPLSGGEPHLLLGRESGTGAVAVSPDGQWIASGGKDHTIRLWPMPDLSKPPLHTLPREELIAKLKTLTNLRVVPDEESVTGWKVEVGPFPGWETVPSW